MYLIWSRWCAGPYGYTCQGINIPAGRVCIVMRFKDRVFIEAALK